MKTLLAEMSFIHHTHTIPTSSLHHPRTCCGVCRQIAESKEYNVIDGSWNKFMNDNILISTDPGTSPGMAKFKDQQIPEQVRE